MIQIALPIQNGTSKTGKAWSRQTYVGVYDSTNPQYPKSIVFDVLGDKIGQFNLQVGGYYEVEVDFAAREWQGRYFLYANCRKAAPLQMQQPYQQPDYGQNSSYPVSPQSATPNLASLGVQGYQQGQNMQCQASSTDGADDLPF